VAIAAGITLRAATGMVDRSDHRDPRPVSRHLGSPRVHAELRLGMGIMVSRKTVAELMQAGGLAGIPRRQTRRNPKVEVFSEDLDLVSCGGLSKLLKHTMAAARVRKARKWVALRS
jgi:hypothetical protein